ncbi:MAG TPA: zinc ribbon domain-containing protein [bacterium]|nr:zinc ribbon domain-containing protein [bacterium]
MAEMICPFCKRIFPADFKWCMDDGSELEQNLGQYEETQDDLNKVPCPDCGEMVDVRDIFCGSCGARLEGRLPEYQPVEEEIYEEEPVIEEPVSEPETEEDEPTRNCPMCGATIGLEDTFCGECGAEVESAVSTFEEGIVGEHCSECGAGLEPGDTHCGVCGTPVGHTVGGETASNKCPGCGAEVTPGDAFCGECGQVLSADDGSDSESGVKCPGCGAEVGAGDEFCGECGAALSAKATKDAVAAGTICPNCGVKVSPDDEFCGECGTALEKTEEVSSSAEIRCPNCGMEVGTDDEFCGTCGQVLKEDKQKQVVEISDVQPEAEKPGRTGGTCPNCGMDVAPGERFCGTCGQDLQEEVVRPQDLGASEEEYVPEPEPEPLIVEDPFGGKNMRPMDISCPNCGMQIPAGSKTCQICGHVLEQDEQPPAEEKAVEITAAGKSCPNCGMDVGIGEDFCGTCGHQLGGESVAEQSPFGDMGETAADEPAVEPAMGSIADITSEIPVCPNCGVEGEPGQEICNACGTPLSAGGGFDAFDQPAVSEDDPFGMNQEYQEPEKESEEMSFEQGAQDDDPFAMSSEPEQVSAEPAGEPSGNEKICSCCGMACPQDAEFCPACGVDFE